MFLRTLSFHFVIILEKLEIQLRIQGGPAEEIMYARE